MVISEHRYDGPQYEPWSLHFRMVPSKLALIIHGSTLVLPSSPTVLRTQSRRAVTSCQWASTSPMNSGSSGFETSYTRITSPAPVIMYGSARSVRAKGRIDLTAKGWAIGGNVLLEACEGCSRHWTVSSEDAGYSNYAKASSKVWIHIPVQSCPFPYNISLILVRWWLSSALNLLRHRGGVSWSFSKSQILMTPIVSAV